MRYTRRYKGWKVVGIENTFSTFQSMITTLSTLDNVKKLILKNYHVPSCRTRVYTPMYRRYHRVIIIYTYRIHITCIYISALYNASGVLLQCNFNVPL